MALASHGYYLEITLASSDISTKPVCKNCVCLPTLIIFQVEEFLSHMTDCGTNSYVHFILNIFFPLQHLEHAESPQNYD